MRFSVRSAFPATHRIRIDARGTREPAHAHNWRVEAWLDSDVPHAADQARAFLDRWVARHEGRSFNDVPPFDRVNPTAEEVARVLAREIAAALPEVRVMRVEVGEAAGFSATYWPDDGPQDPATPQA
jgi:6-pyruvoyltetrahydropterin/6-carboxytetrahydropterin synthase